MDKLILVVGALTATIAAVKASQKAYESWRKVIASFRETEQPEAVAAPTNGARPQEAEALVS